VVKSEGFHRDEEVDCDGGGGGRGATQAGVSGSQGTPLKPLTLNRSLPVAVLERLRDRSDDSGKVRPHSAPLPQPVRLSLQAGWADRTSGGSAVKVREHS
jgi:hypothetical protein